MCLQRYALIRTFNPLVTGSNPVRPTKDMKGSAQAEPFSRWGSGTKVRDLGSGYSTLTPCSLHHVSPQANRWFFYRDEQVGRRLQRAINHDRSLFCGSQRNKSIQSTSAQSWF